MEGELPTSRKLHKHSARQWKREEGRVAGGKGGVYPARHEAEFRIRNLT